MRFEISVDDGNYFDLGIAELINRIGFTATFYIPLNCNISVPAIRYLAKSNHIGAHTVTHPMDIKKLKKSQVIYELKHSKEILEDIICRDVVDFCYPRGRFNDQTKRLARKVGYETARTTKVFCNKNTDPYEYDPTIHFYNDRKEYKEKYPKKDIVDIFQEEFRIALKDGEYFHVWLHSFELIDNNLLDKFAYCLDWAKSELKSHNEKNLHTEPNKQ